MKKLERQERILESASKLFAEKRFDEVLMEEVAQEAGVGKGTLYRYFCTKEDLYFAVIFAGIAQLKDQLHAAAATVEDPLVQLEKALRAIVTFLSRNRFFFRLMTIEESKSEKPKSEFRQRWKQERGELLAAIGAVLQRGGDSGVFEIRHLNTEAQILLGMVRSVLRFNEDNLGPDEIVSEILRIFLGGVLKK